MKFTRDLNIYQWSYSLVYQKLLNSGLGISLIEDFRTTLQRTSSQDRWKDNQTFSLNFNYPIKNKIFLRPQFHSQILSDPLAGFDNDVKFHSGVVRLVYEPKSDISIAPGIGSKWQTQIEQSDQAFSYGLDGRFGSIDFGGYKSELTVFGERDVFPRRSNHDLSIRYEVQKQFYDSTADTLTVFSDFYRRDSFGVDGSGVFVRSLAQSSRGIENRLSYKMSSNSSVYLKNAILLTTFKVQNVQDNEVDLRKDDTGIEANHSVAYSLEHGKWLGNLSWNYRTRSRDDRRAQEAGADPFQSRHPSLGFDTEERFASWDLRAGYKPTTADSVGLFVSASKFQFDTSDTTNANDHDQLRWQFTVAYEHSFGPHLRLLWRGSAFVSHFVYLSGTFSSGNNWERVLQLAPQIVYRPSSRFSFRQSFAVRAKYLTYDFDDPETSNRNIVNRQFVFSNRSRYAFSDATLLDLGFSFELAEQGRLFYSLWRQRLALSWQNQEAQIVLRHRLGNGLTVSPGANVFHQTRWTHGVNQGGGQVKAVKDNHTNVGPLLHLSYRPEKALELTFDGNIQFVIASRRKTERINSFDVNLNWFF